MEDIVNKKMVFLLNFIKKKGEDSFLKLSNFQGIFNLLGSEKTDILTSFSSLPACVCFPICKNYEILNLVDALKDLQISQLFLA